MRPYIAPLMSQSPNAKYGPDDMLDVLLQLCSQNMYVSTGIEIMSEYRSCMTSQRVLQLLGEKNLDYMLDHVLDMLDAAARLLKESGRLGGPVVLAVDDHLIERYDKKGPYHKGGKKKNGTNHFEGYTTAQIVSSDKPLTLAAYAIANGESQSHYLGGLVENVRRLGVLIDVLLLDRGFNSVCNIREMKKLSVPYIMPLSGNKKLYRMMEEYDAGTGGAIREYEMTNKKGEKVTATLVICRKDNPGKITQTSDKYIAFLTNLPTDNPEWLIKYIPKTYRYRWGIETGYRVIKQIRAKTMSPYWSARLFLFFFSLVYANFWLIYRRMIVDGSEEYLTMSVYRFRFAIYVMFAGRPP